MSGVLTLPTLAVPTLNCYGLGGMWKSRSKPSRFCLSYSAATTGTSTSLQQARFQDRRLSHQVVLGRDGVTDLDRSHIEITNGTQTMIVFGSKGIFVIVLRAGQMVTVKIEFAKARDVQRPDVRHRIFNSSKLIALR